jgi:hypothetical protein
MASIRFSTLIFLFLLSSCAYRPRVSALGCSTQALWLSGGPSAGEEFIIEQSLWLTPGDDVIPLRDILERHNISCASVQTLSMGWTTTSSDSLISFLPFIQKKTLQLSGTKTSFTDEDRTREGSN